MKITAKVMRQRAKQPLKSVTYLDLSSLGIGVIEELDACPNLQMLDMSCNKIEEIEGITCCPHLWSISFANNQISCLNELANFYAFGSLDLSYNNLSWKDLTKLRNVIILDLHLYGNSLLEKDIYYRIHVIDCLPNVWMLDGSIISSTERLQVQQFFHDSALCKHPVRRKMLDRLCTVKERKPSIHCIHGFRTLSLVKQFPVNEVQSGETDVHRLEYLSKNAQIDITIMGRNAEIRTRSDSPLLDCCLQDIIRNRPSDRERCNMLLLLLVASLEFNIPGNLISETLSVARLNPYVGVDTGPLFRLRSKFRIRVACLLMSASKLDRDMRVDGSGGLYDRLYLCLYCVVSRLVRSGCRALKENSIVGEYFKLAGQTCPDLHPHTAPASKIGRMSAASFSKRFEQLQERHRMLLASEIVLLLSAMPLFYNLIETDSNMQMLLRSATGSENVARRILNLARETREHGGDVGLLHNEISEHVVHQIEIASIDTRLNLRQHALFPHDYHPTVEPQSEWKIILNTKNAYPKRPKSAILISSERLTSGRRGNLSGTLRKPNHAIPNSGVVSHQTQLTGSDCKMSLGSEILLGPQNMAKVIAMPEPSIALVQMNTIPAPNGSIVIQGRNADDHYCYVDRAMLELDRRLGCWKPRGAVGDRITLQTELHDERKSPLLSRMPDSRLYDKVSAKQLTTLKSGGTLPNTKSCESADRKQAFVIANDNEQREDKSAKECGDLDLQNAMNMMPPRPLSAIYKEKMDLRLPSQFSDAWIEPESPDQANGLLPITPVPPSNPESVVTVPAACLGVSEDFELSVSDCGMRTLEVRDQDASDVQGKEGQDKFEPNTHELANDAHEPSLMCATWDEELQDITDNACQPNEGGVGVIENGSELKQDEPDNTGQLYSKTVYHPKLESYTRKRAISARRPKQSKIHSSQGRPVSAVVGTKGVYAELGSSCWDDAEFERPDSATSFQFEMTEAWRSSTSSFTHLHFEPENNTVHHAVGSMDPHKHPRITFQIVALHPTPPQRPTSPSQACDVKQAVDAKSITSRPSKVVTTSDRSKGIKLASSWLAEGKDLYQEYKQKRVYMFPHLPGYLDGTPAHINRKKGASSSLPLATSHIPTLHTPPLLRNCRHRVPAVNAKVGEYLPPGVGIPMSCARASVPSTGGVRKLLGRSSSRRPAKPCRKLL